MAVFKTLQPEGHAILAAFLCILSGMGFLLGGVGFLFSQAWATRTIITAAILSTVLYALFWDGRRTHLDRQGGIGVLLNVAILATILLFY